MDSDDLSEGNASRLVTGDASSTADAITDVQRALSNIEQLNPNHPLIQRVQRDTGIQDPQVATQYTEQTLRAMKEHANENPERMRSIFMSSRSKKERDLDGSFLHDGYDSF
jgi:protein-tyrosine-phosphatase